MFDLPPPRHISTLRILLVAERPGEGRLTERTPAVRPRWQGLLFMPHIRVGAQKALACAYTEAFLVLSRSDWCCTPKFLRGENDGPEGERNETQHLFAVRGGCPRARRRSAPIWSLPSAAARSTSSGSWRARSTSGPRRSGQAAYPWIEVDGGVQSLTLDHIGRHSGLPRWRAPVIGPRNDHRNC